LAVGLSGGADSVALLRALAARSAELGLVLHAAHLHHGLRGAEADSDLEFCRELAAKLGIPFHEARVDTAAEARASERDSCGIESHPSRKNPPRHGGQERRTARVGHPVALDRSDYAAMGKARESIEEAARRLRYAWFRQLMAADEVDAVATAHTLDDQAETVLAKFLRGAWTEGLAGISPKLESPEGRILRPMLAATRAEVETYLLGLGQEWREDSSNRHLSFTRNRIRHELLPLLERWNPRLRVHLAQMAALAHDEEAWWADDLARLGPQILMPGRPVRGGGRAGGEGLALDVMRLAALPVAMQRRLLRYAAEQLGAALDFPATEALRELALAGRAGQKRELAGGLRAERTPREVRLRMELAAGSGEGAAGAEREYKTEIPGEIVAKEFGIRLRIELVGKPGAAGGLEPGSGRVATLRNWSPGDRVRLRHSSGARKVKEVLERKRVTGSSRAVWPVLELDGRIVWMQGVELEPEPGIAVTAERLRGEGVNCCQDGTSAGG